MNNSTLGYSFIDSNNSDVGEKETEDIKHIKPTNILNKLTKMKANKLATVSEQQPSVKPRAISDDETDNYEKVNLNTTNPLIANVEGFNNYDMNSANNEHYTTLPRKNDNNPTSADETLYDFGKHMPSNIASLERHSTVDESTNEKINYIIHMLEQNRQLRTENITEEMIMYFFLGFFVLYISENFVKMGKYSR